MGRDKRAKKQGPDAKPVSISPSGSTSPPSSSVSPIDHSMKEMSLAPVSARSTSTKLPPGKMGTPYRFKVNLFGIKVNGFFHFYNVTMYDGRISKKEGGAGDGATGEPKKMEQVTRKAVLEEYFEVLKDELTKPGQLLHNKRLAYDNSANLFVANANLNINPLEPFVYKMEIGGKAVKLVIKVTGAYDEKYDAETTDIGKQAMDVALGYGASHRLIRRGDNFFEKFPSNKLPVWDNRTRQNTFHSDYEYCGYPMLEFRYGVYKSVRPLEGGLFVNIEIAGGIFNKGGSILSMLPKLIKHPQVNLSNLVIDQNMSRIIISQLKDLKFNAVEPKAFAKRRHRFIGLTNKGADQEMFDFEGKKITVARYFEETYKYKLKYPKLPCVIDKRPNGFVKMFPIEICHLINDQYYSVKLGERIQGEMAKMCIVGPDIRHRQIMTQALPHMLPKGITGKDGNDVMDYKLSNEMITVDGRILNSPSLKQNTTPVSITPVLNCKQINGKGPNPADFKLSTLNSTIELKTWAVIQITSRKMDTLEYGAKNFVDRMMAEAGKLGMRISKPSRLKCIVYDEYQGGRSNIETLKNTFAELKEITGIQMALVFFPPNKTAIYNDVKYQGNYAGIITSMLQYDALNPGRKQEQIVNFTFLTNMIMKINAKLGGTTTGVKEKTKFLKDNRVMFVGIDVTHHDHGQNREMKRSIAAIVASHNEEYNKYFQDIRMQENPKTEIMGKGAAQLKEAIVGFLTKFRAKNGNYPNVIMVFRDGVSDGEFEKVKNNEVFQIHEALKEMGLSKPAIRLTYITSQKRHKFRMFPEEKDGRIKNPLPGSIIDSKIVSEHYNEYYLVSSHALKGTAKPTKYTVIHNEVQEMTNDELEGISYLLCHLVSRCTKPISLTAPVKWAHHLAAFGAALHDSATRNGLDLKYVAVNPKLADTTFYA